jgi:hypothetical protein
MDHPNYYFEILFFSSRERQMGGKGKRTREQMDAHNERRKAKRALLKAEREKKKREERRRKREEWRERKLGRTLEEEVRHLRICHTPLFSMDEEKLDLKTIALRFLLSGRTFSDFTVFQNFEKEKLGKAEFFSLAEKVYEKIDEVAAQQLREKREKLQGKSIFFGGGLSLGYTRV